MTDPLRETMKAMDRYETPFVALLRSVCESIGYGRVIQIAEGWMEEKNPGWLAAKRAVIIEQDGSDGR